MKLVFNCLGLLPFICLILTISCFHYRAARKSWFYAIASGSIFWSLFIIIETNLLSAFNSITQGWITAVWLGYTSITGALLYQWRLRIKPEFRFSAAWAPILLVLALTLLDALAYAPSYHDSLAYHLPRVLHWLQNGSVGPYLTSIDRQVGMAPFNSFVILQSMAICNNDYFVNLPQWLAFAGTICGVMQLAGELGGGRAARMLTGFYFCTLPIAIMQAANSENSLIATFWLCLFIAAFLDWRRNPDLLNSFIIGAALGLAILSKGIAYPVALPFVLCIAWRCLVRFKSCFIYGALAGALVLAINLPHFYRIYKATDSLVMSAERNIIHRPYPALVAVNAAFNFLSQEPWIISLLPKREWSALALKLGVDDHDTIYFPWRGIEHARANLVPSDNDGQSPIHALLIPVLALILLCRRFRGVGLYMALVSSTFLLYFTIITWQPWMPRLHLPFFMLAAPLMGLGLAQITWKPARYGTLAALALTAIMPLFFCLEHPLGPGSWLKNYREGIMHFLVSSREEQYFNLWCHQTRYPYLRAAHYLAAQKPESVGVDLADDGLEYPLWGVLRDNLPKMPRITHTLPPYPEDGPEYIFRQRHSSFSQLLDPVILKKEDGGYRQVFPAPKENQTGPATDT